MMTVIIIMHVIACVGLIGLILIQRGRGSGLVESFQGVESMFGTKTNTFLTRTTTVLSIVFFFTCLSLAVLSIRQSRSLMRDIKPTSQKAAVNKKSEAPSAKSETPAAKEVPPAKQEKDTADKK